MAKNYIDKRRTDRLNERSIQLRNKELVKKLDAYCLLTDTKLTRRSNWKKIKNWYRKYANTNKGS